MKRVLMIAYHYPPCFGSSGIQRTLKFSRHLPDSTWQPVILTAHARAYPETNEGQLGEIPEGMPVRRAFALDTARHLSVRGHFPRRLALPDRWASWWLGAVPAGLSLIRRYRPAVLWSTYPIGTAHLIARTLHRLSGLPWVADFRDPMVQDDHPEHPLDRKVYLKLEAETVSSAERLVFTAESARTTYLRRYPALAAGRCLLIPNGYDEEDFRTLPLPSPLRAGNGHPFRLVHAGLIYPEARDPRVFFRALSVLKASHGLCAGALRIELRSSGWEDDYRSLLRELRIDDLVFLLPALPYRQTLEDCSTADALLLLQGAYSNHQIPAKTYEYLRLRRPILALTPREGDTAVLLRETGGATIVDLTDEAAIRKALPDFLASLRNGTHTLPSHEKVLSYDRRMQTQRLAACLDEAAGASFAPGSRLPKLLQGTRYR